MTGYFSDKDIAQYIEQGPLNGVIAAYAALLSRQGFSKISAHQQLRFLADMNRWLHQKRLSTSDLTAPTIQRYLRSRHRRLRPRRDDAAILNRLVHLLNTHTVFYLKMPPGSLLIHISTSTMTLTVTCLKNVGFPQLPGSITDLTFRNFCPLNLAINLPAWMS
jgi:hypothetical protein